MLSYWRDQVKNPVALLKPRINDPHPRVRVEALRACSFFPAEEVQEAALDALNFDTDTYVEYTLDETMRALEAQ